MTTVLAVSPHLDDAVFSAGGALARAAATGARVIVATLFTGNVTRPDGFALACQTDKGIGAGTDYMALRRAEDRRACAVLGAEAWHCPLLEAPHRGYGSAAALFAGPAEADDSRELSGMIVRLISEARPDAVWAPRAVGHHVDHVLTHRVLRAMAPVPRILWWTDWPYADRPAAPDTETPELGAIDWLDVPLTSSLRARKVEACAAYASQLGFQFGGEAVLRARLELQSSERFAVGGG